MGVLFLEKLDRPKRKKAEYYKFMITYRFCRTGFATPVFAAASGHSHREFLYFSSFFISEMVKSAHPGLQTTGTPNTSFAEDSSQNEIKHSNQAENTNTLQSRLSGLRPSRQLLEFYRKKIAEYDDEHADMFDKINSIEHLCDNQQKSEVELRNRECEISNLQKALSDLQNYMVVLEKCRENG